MQAPSPVPPAKVTRLAAAKPATEVASVGLGQFMEVGAREGHELDLQAMFDRVDHPARGRRGGASGAPTTIAQDDGTAMKGPAMKGNGKQFVPHGRKVRVAFPGGAGYGKVAERAVDQVRRDQVRCDLALGYITAGIARLHYHMAPVEIADVLARARTRARTRARKGEIF